MSIAPSITLLMSDPCKYYGVARRGATATALGGANTILLLGWSRLPQGLAVRSQLVPYCHCLGFATISLSHSVVGAIDASSEIGPQCNFYKKTPEDSNFI